MDSLENQASDLLNGYPDSALPRPETRPKPDAQPRPEDTRQRQTIKDWAEDDRPREKLGLKGAPALSNAELIAILLNSGTTQRDAVEVARDLLHLAGQDLDRLGKMDLKEYQRISGIGPARAITLKAALELGHRRQNTASESYVITSSSAAYDYMGRYLRYQQTEQFWILLLNRAMQVMRPIKVGDGGVNSVMADQRVIFRHALLELAAGVVLVHNHPSGQLKPSQDDDRLTQTMQRAGECLNIPVKDHLIYTDRGYYSYADEGRL